VSQPRADLRHGPMGWIFPGPWEERQRYDDVDCARGIRARCGCGECTTHRAVVTRNKALTRLGARRESLQTLRREWFARKSYPNSLHREVP